MTKTAAGLAFVLIAISGQAAIAQAVYTPEDGIVGTVDALGRVRAQEGGFVGRIERRSGDVRTPAAGFRGTALPHAPLGTLSRPPAGARAAAASAVPVSPDGRPISSLSDAELKALIEASLAEPEAPVLSGEDIEARKQLGAKWFGDTSGDEGTIHE